jgi:hypothetical protein
VPAAAVRRKSSTAAFLPYFINGILSSFFFYIYAAFLFCIFLGGQFFLIFFMPGALRRARGARHLVPGKTTGATPGALDLPGAAPGTAPGTKCRVFLKSD